jgi:hypothetical protein
MIYTKVSTQLTRHTQRSRMTDEFTDKRFLRTLNLCTSVSSSAIIVSLHLSCLELYDCVITTQGIATNICVHIKLMIQSYLISSTYYFERADYTVLTVLVVRLFGSLRFLTLLRLTSSALSSSPTGATIFHRYSS